MGGSTLDLLNHYMNMLFIASGIAAAIFGALAWYLLKVKKVKAREEQVNYASFTRTDSTEFVKFDNIISCKYGNGNSFGIVVVDKYTFIGVMDIKGYNFSTASYEEKQRTIANSIAFFNTVERPIQMRQSVKKIDISYNIEKHREVCRDLEGQMIELDQDYQSTLALYNEHINGGNDTVVKVIEERLVELQKQILSTKWKSKEAQAILDYMNRVSSSGNAVKINQLVFSYTYDPNEFSQELSDEEIYMKASSELSIMANNYISLLGNCGCSCKLLDGTEILELIRRHNHPLTCDDIPIKDLFNSSYSSLFISSDSMLQVERKKVGEKRMNEMLQAINADIGESHLRTMNDSEELASQLLKSVEHYVEREMASKA